MVLDSWLNSVHSDDNWKWIHCASGELSTTASHQNQRPHRFTFSGGFLCRGVRCSFTVHLFFSLQLASTLCVLCGFYKVTLCVRLYNELVQPRTRSVYGCCEATKKSRHHDCVMCQLTSISSVIPLCLVIFALFMVLYLTFSSCRIVVRICFALLEIFLSCML